MNISINHWLTRHPKIKEWLWFWALWLGGLAAVLMLSYPLKLLVKFL